MFSIAVFHFSRQLRKLFRSNPEIVTYLKIMRQQRVTNSQGNEQLHNVPNFISHVSQQDSTSHAVHRHMCRQTDKETDGHTDMMITILPTSCRGEESIVFTARTCQKTTLIATAVSHTLQLS